MTTSPERWAAVDRLYHAALVRPVSERAAFLADSCAGDEELRREVESLLAQAGSADAVFTGGAAVAAAGLVSEDTRSARSTYRDRSAIGTPGTSADFSNGSAAPGAMLGNYRIERLLGRGGMGAVFLAYDTTLHRHVALKIVETLGDSDARTRVLREARNAAALNHPHICTIHEVEHIGGVAFIAMEYVEGTSLRERLDRGPLPLDEALKLGIAAAEALAYAHDRGVVHRDFKAANVIVGGDGRLKIVDFGLARRSDALIAATTMPSLVPEGIVAGTPYTMAPEQVRGEPADRRTDIWALGVLMQEMLTGRAPFSGATVPELFAAILARPPAPLPASLPAALHALLRRSFEKDRADRYQSMPEMLADLRRIERDTEKAILAGRRSPPLIRWAEWASATLVVVGLALWVGPFPIDRTRPPNQSRLSTGAPASSNPDANEAFERSMVLLRRRWETAQAQKLLTRAVELDPRFAEARAFLGFSYLLQLSSGDSSDGGSLYRGEEEVRRALQDDPNLVRAHAGLGAIYVYLRRSDLAKVEIDEALRLGPDDLTAVHWLAEYSHVSGDFAAAKAALQKNLARDPLFLPSRLLLADVLREEGQLELSIRETNKILEEDPGSVQALWRMARAYLDSGDATKATATIIRVGEARDRNYLVRLVAAMIYASEGQRAEARQVLDAKLLEFAEAHILGSVAVAEVYAVLDEKESAVEWFARGVRGGDERLEWFERDPLLANIRQHSRFKQILESIAYRRQQRNASGQPR